MSVDVQEAGARPEAGRCRASYVAAGAALGLLTDHELLAEVARDQVLLNRVAGAQQAKILELFDRRAADYRARQANDPNFTLTPGHEVAVEVAPLVGMTEARVREDLRTCRRLRDRFPDIWALVGAGRLDLYRAGMVATAAKRHLSDPEAVAELASRMATWFAQQWAKQTGRDDAGDDAGDGDGDTGGGGAASEEDLERVLSVTVRQIGNRLSYLVTKLRPKDAQKRHDRQYEDRSAQVSSLGDGMGALYLTSDVVSLRALDHRLSLIAKALRRAGDERTVAQLRTDLAVELLLGKITVGAETGEFERAATDPDSRTGGTEDGPLASIRTHRLGAWARPVVNVTVPIQTLMGISDEPGVLSGGEVLPAGLVRAIAADPDSTWYRMLTDPARRCVELSTTSYKPTAAITRQVVVDWGTCFAPPCTIPASEAELDHRVAAPEGATSTENLGPGCKGHHKVKHAPGFGLIKEPNGRMWLTTAGGFAHRVGPAEQPVGEDWGDPEMWEPVTPSQLREALSWLGYGRARSRESDELIARLEREWAEASGAAAEKAAKRQERARLDDETLLELDELDAENTAREGGH